MKTLIAIGLSLISLSAQAKDYTLYSAEELVKAEEFKSINCVYKQKHFVNSKSRHSRLSMLSSQCLYSKLGGQQLQKPFIVPAEDIHPTFCRL